MKVRAPLTPPITTEKVTNGFYPYTPSRYTYPILSNKPMTGSDLRFLRESNDSYRLGRPRSAMSCVMATERDTARFSVSDDIRAASALRTRSSVTTAPLRS